MLVADCYGHRRRRPGCQLTGATATSSRGSLLTMRFGRRICRRDSAAIIGLLGVAMGRADKLRVRGYQMTNPKGLTDAPPPPPRPTRRPSPSPRPIRPGRKAQMTKYPEGRQASAIIPLLWRAQEQEGWLTRPAIEHVSRDAGAGLYSRAGGGDVLLHVPAATGGQVAHIQICGTTSCMICGAEDLVAVCRDKIAKRPHEISADGRVKLGRGRVSGSLRQRADGADRQGLLRGSDGRAVLGDAGRLSCWQRA